jgi:hypothetical protein
MGWFVPIDEPKTPCTLKCEYALQIKRINRLPLTSCAMIETLDAMHQARSTLQRDKRQLKRA